MSTGKDGRTIAVEPNPYVFGLLSATASVHSSSIEAVQVALSDVTGYTTLVVPDNFYGDASIVERKDKPRLSRSRVDVKTQTLDDLAVQLALPRIDLVKIDVEGAEPRVFDGMKETIAKNSGLRILAIGNYLVTKGPRGPSGHDDLSPAVSATLGFAG